MGFNKIKTMTNNLQDLIEALKDSTFVEFNQDFTKIRKKTIISEFSKI